MAHAGHVSWPPVTGVGPTGLEDQVAEGEEEAEGEGGGKGPAFLKRPPAATHSTRIGVGV